jgi:aminopeptidase YwaD
MSGDYLMKAKTYLGLLCGVKPNRRVGSAGNHDATDFLAKTFASLGYAIDATPFECLDFESGDAFLTNNGEPFEVYISPFTLGCDTSAELVVVSTVEELENCICKDKLLLMKGEICSEPLMPKNFVFYNPDYHKKIYALLEQKLPAAIITATKQNPQIAGAVYPFPFINDGDFNIPTVYCTDQVGEKLASKAGKLLRLKVDAKRIPATACNVIARKNPDAQKKVVICAHVDAKENTLGATDNASGIIVELLLAEMLSKYQGNLGIEIVAFNGEDYYSAGGEMDYLHRCSSDFDKILVAINIDGAGYFEGNTAYSLYDCPPEIQQKAKQAFGVFGLIEGGQWYQGDHSMFVQSQQPAIAFTSEKAFEMLATITHTPNDTPKIVDCQKLVDLAYALESFIISL